MLLLFFLTLCVAVFGSAGKFRSCSSTSFCERQRGLDHVTYALDPQSVSFKDNQFNALLVNNAQQKLSLSISRVINNVIRVFVTELNGIRKRYEVKDVLTKNARSNFLEFSNIDQQINYCVLSWQSYSVKIQYKPFEIVVSNNGVTEMIINDQQKFYFEIYEKRKESENEESEESEENKKKWEERHHSHTYYHDSGAASIGLDFTFVDSDYVFGIPEHASSFALKNTLNDESENSYNEPFRLWNLDVFEYPLDVPDSLYGAIPYVVSPNKQNMNAVFWCNAAETYIDIKDDIARNGRNVRWMSESGVIEAFVLLHSNRNSNDNYLYEYHLLSGKPQLPPIFALGHHQCRWNYNNIKEVKEVSDMFDKLNIPNDVIWLDIEHTDGKRYFTFDYNNFQDPTAMIDYVSASGRKMVTIVDPHIKKDSDYYIYSEIDNSDLWVKDRDGNVFEGWCWPGTSNYPDFTNPKMRQLWANKFDYNSYKHSSRDLHIWNDMNEPSVFSGGEVTMDISNIHFDGWTHNEIHNIYGYYVHMATFNGLLQRDNSKYRPFVLSRAFFAGTQRYGAIWTGDNTANWEHLKISVPMLLSLSVSGLPFVGADIGGFFNNPNGELMARWYELGSFYPFFRNHAHQQTERRELWKFQDAYAERMKHSILGRYRLLPYIYTLFYKSHNSSDLIISPIWYFFGANNPEMYEREDCFMFGPALYVHPIVNAGVSEIEVDLPQNQEGNAVWYETNGKEINAYGAGKHLLTGYDSRIPALRYGGSIVVEKHRLRRSASLMKDDPITIVIALNANACAYGEHYMDDQETLNHISNNEFIFQKLRFEVNKLDNEIVHSSDSDNLEKIEIERIVIIGLDLNKQSFESIHIKQLSNSRKTRQFGTASNTLVIRKPQIFINLPFEIVLE